MRRRLGVTRAALLSASPHETKRGYDRDLKHPRSDRSGFLLASHLTRLTRHTPCPPPHPPHASPAPNPTPHAPASAFHPSASNTIPP